MSQNAKRKKAQRRVWQDNLVTSGGRVRLLRAKPAGLEPQAGPDDPFDSAESTTCRPTSVSGSTGPADAENAKAHTRIDGARESESGRNRGGRKKVPSRGS